jgi:Na+-transporting methylmalonyl-CoA/oxaloacetate decarboxylase gamma subunit
VSRRTGIALAVLGAVIVLLSLVALAYAFWPAGSLTQQAPLAPTLFVSP